MTAIDHFEVTNETAAVDRMGKVGKCWKPAWYKLVYVGNTCTGREIGGEATENRAENNWVR